MKRVVLDTSVLVSGFRSRYGASQRLLRLVVEQRLVLLATPALFLEYEDVLKRPEQREVSGLSVAQVDLALAAISVAVEPVEIHFSWRPQLADADDEMVLEAALVTHNVADFALAAPKFGLAVLRPGALLERLMS